MAEMNEDIILNVNINYDKAINAIVDMRRQIDDLRKTNDSLKESNDKMVDKTSAAYRANAKEIEKNNIAIKELSYESRTLSKQFQNQVREQNSAEGSLKQLRAQLSQMTKTYDELSRKQRDGAFGQTLQKQILQTTEELKKAEAGTERFYRNVGNYENALKNAFGLNNQFANSIMGLVRSGGGVQGFFGAATTAVKSFGAALMSLLSNPVFLAIAGIAGAVSAFKWFYDYNQGIAEATRLTREFMNIEGDALRGVRDSIQATADVMGKDYVEVLKTVDTLMKQYDISAEKAIEIVNKGFASGADLSGDMLDKLKQYAPSFRDAGIAADEMMAIIAQTRSGIFSDKGLDVISMANKRIREMSSQTASSLDAIGISSKQVQADLVSGAKSTFDVIQMVSARMKELPQNSQEVGQVLKDVFGRTAAEGGLKMIETLDTMSKSLDEVMEQTGEYGQLQLEQIEAQNELNDAVSTLFDMSGKGWEEMMTQAKIWVTRHLTNIIKGLIDIINYFIDLYNESIEFRAAVNGIIGAFRTMWNMAKMVFNNLISAIKNVGKALLGLVETLAGVMTGLTTGNFTLAKRGFEMLQSAVMGGIKDQGDNMTNWAKEQAEIMADTINNTLKKEKIQPLQSALGVDSGTGGGGSATGGGSSSSGGSGGKGAAAKAAAARAKQIESQAKAEQEQLRKLGDLMNKLIEDNYEQQRQTIISSYDRQIADIRAKLADEGKYTITARRAMYAQIDALEQLKNRDLQKLDEQRIKKEVETENQRIALKLQAIKKGTDAEEALRMQQLDNEQALQSKNIENTIYDEQKRNEMLIALDEAYYAKRQALAQEYRDKEREDMLLAMKNDLAEKMMVSNDEVEKLRLQLEELQAVRDAARQKQDETDEQWRARQLEMDKAVFDKKKELAEKEIAMEQAKVNAIGQIMGSLGQIMDEFADKNRSIAIASKVLAIAEVGIQQGIAIANAIRAALEGSHSWWEAAAQIAVGVASVTTSMLSAIKSIKSAKFSTGGLVLGAGSGTSDSIPAWLSNGESVINANSTAMFAPLLSAINQLGGGIPITYNGQSQMGEDFLAAAVAKGMAFAPRPVVSVEDINRGQQRVEVVTNLGSV